MLLRIARVLAFAVVLSLLAACAPPIYVCTPLQRHVLVCQPARICGETLCVDGPR